MNQQQRMSRVEAVSVLAEMARRAEDGGEITAIRLACRNVLKRHLDHMVNKLNRRARKEICQSSAKTDPNCQTLANPPAPACQPSAISDRICQALANGTCPARKTGLMIVAGKCAMENYKLRKLVERMYIIADTPRKLGVFQYSKNSEAILDEVASAIAAWKEEKADEDA